MMSKFFSSITFLGHPFFYIALLFVLLYLNFPLAMDIAIALVVLEALCIGIKIAYKKERPIPQSRKGIYNLVDASSFPSVHSARAALLAAMLNAHYKNTLLLAGSIMITLLVGYSRIYLKRHYFSDVLFGFIIGAAIAWLALYL